MLERNIIWNEAGKAGLVIGAVSGGYIIICSLLAGAEGTAALIVANIVSMLLWVVKFGGCIWLMWLFMKRFAAAYSDADNSDTFRFGRAVALLSALITASCFLVNCLFIDPDQFTNALDLFRDNPMMTSESMDMMEQMAPKLPRFGFFFNLIYCYIFGAALAAIFSRSIPSTNPFAGEDEASEDDDQ